MRGESHGLHVERTSINAVECGRTCGMKRVHTHVIAGIIRGRPSHRCDRAATLWIHIMLVIGYASPMAAHQPYVCVCTARLLLLAFKCEGICCNQML